MLKKKKKKKQVDVVLRLQQKKKKQKLYKYVIFINICFLIMKFSIIWLIYLYK